MKYIQIHLDMLLPFFQMHEHKLDDMIIETSNPIPLDVNSIGFVLDRKKGMIRIELDKEITEFPTYTARDSIAKQMQQGGPLRFNFGGPK